MGKITMEQYKILYDKQEQTVQQVFLEQQAYLQFEIVLCISRQALLFMERIYFVVSSEQLFYKLLR